MTTLAWIVVAELVILVALIGFVVYRLHRDLKEQLPPEIESLLEARWIADRVKKGQGFEE